MLSKKGYGKKFNCGILNIDVFRIIKNKLDSVIFIKL